MFDRLIKLAQKRATPTDNSRKAQNRFNQFVVLPNEGI